MNAYMQKKRAEKEARRKARAVAKLEALLPKAKRKYAAAVAAERADLGNMDKRHAALVAGNELTRVEQSIKAAKDPIAWEVQQTELEDHMSRSIHGGGRALMGMVADKVMAEE